MKNLIEKHRAAGYAAIAVQTVEEDRFLAETIPTLEDEGDVFYISALNRLEDARTGDIKDDKFNYAKAFKLAAEQPCLLIVADFRHVISTPINMRLFLEHSPAWKSIGSMVVFLGADWGKIPIELKHYLHVLHHDLPDKDGIERALKTVCDASGLKPDQETVERLVRDGCGLTQCEAEDGYALAAINGNGSGFDLSTVAAEKAKVITNDGMLKMLDPVPRDKVGGLLPMVRYGEVQIAENIADPIRRVKGILQAGVAGCGKTLFSRVLGHILGVPILEGDLSACKSGLQGSSQANLRSMLATVKAFGPCVLLLDEIEKAVGGSSSSAHTDGGTGLEMLGILLKWLDDNETATVVFTCNDYDILANISGGALIRPGRIDKQFFVDLPSRIEREEIAKIHLSRFECVDPKLHSLAADLSVDFSGAEIEQLAKESARLAPVITAKEIKAAAADIVPASLTQQDQLAALRAQSSRFTKANTPDPVTPKKSPARKTGRTIKK